MAGVSWLDVGPVVMPPVPQLAFAAHHHTNLPFALQLGAGVALARLPYDDRMSGTSWLAGPELAVAGSHSVRPGIAVIASAALGAQRVSGLDEGNPFTADGRASDPIWMPRARVELGAAWRAGHRLTVRVVPLGYQFSPRRPPLAADIPALHGLTLSAGVAVDL
jgi:hypothetical protein